ncbi:MAG: hypothetical protein H0X51_04630 [Parachlamydiaceae bacterium]|nr:hypothetical protein [Parachlamydiaceae bacterium]
MASTYLSQFVKFCNQPVVKESVKTAVGGISFAFGVFEILHETREFVLDLRGRVTFQEKAPWHHTALKAVLFVSKVSLICSAITTRPGVQLASWAFSRIFTKEQLEVTFGKNLTFAKTPWHPRHVTSVAAFLLGVPATLKTIYDGLQWLRSKCCICSSTLANVTPPPRKRRFVDLNPREAGLKTPQVNQYEEWKKQQEEERLRPSRLAEEARTNRWLQPSYIQGMATYNTVTSRVVQHWANRLFTMLARR